MGIHAAPDPETAARLARQQRWSSMASIFIAFLALAILGLLLALWAFTPLLRIDDPPVVYSAEMPTEEPPAPKPRTTRQTPAAPPAFANQIAAQVAAPLALPVSEVEMPSLDFGSGDDFGDGLAGDGWGEAGNGSGSSSGFGSTQRIAGALVGRLFDFKQTAEREPNPDYPTDQAGINRGDTYVEYVTEIHRRDFSERAFRDFYRAPTELSLTHLAIPFSPATEGPKHFGAEKTVQPSGWVAHYRGDLVVPETGRYRFVGIADDYMAVAIDGRIRLVASWPSLQDRVRGRWDPADESGRWNSPIGDTKLIFGDWIKLGKGETVHMDLGIGERPGGMVGFLLMIEKQGEEYREGPDGRPILPLFTTAPFSDDAREQVTRLFPGFEFEWDKVPVFPAH